MVGVRPMKPLWFHSGYLRPLLSSTVRRTLILRHSPMSKAPHVELTTSEPRNPDLYDFQIASSVAIPHANVRLIWLRPSDGFTALKASDSCVLESPADLGMH